MNEQQHIQNCPACGNVLSERGYFCASCTVQARCKQCNELLEKDARACVMCGTPVGAGPANGAANSHSAPMNTLELQEDTRNRSLRISFTDAAIGSIGETVNRLISDKLASQGPRSFRTTGGLVPMAPQLPAGAPGHEGPIIDTKPDEGKDARPDDDGKPAVPPTGDAERLREIFEINGDDVRLEEHRLKADSRLEHARRLTYLFIYAMELAGKKPISYSSVKKMLDASKVLDTNTRHELAHKMAVEIEGDTIRLKKQGREKAIQALDEILNPNHPDPGWTPESSSRSAKAGAETKKDGKPSGKVGRKRSNVAEEWAAKWEKHADTVNGHFILKGKTVLDKGILALWAIHKVGGASASSLYIQRFIATAFSFTEKDRTLETTLSRENAREFVIRADGGFKLTPSGTKRAAEMVKAAK